MESEYEQEEVIGHLTGVHYSTSFQLIALENTLTRISLGKAVEDIGMTLSP
jgi:hypothetical protein